MDLRLEPKEQYLLAVLTGRISREEIFTLLKNVCDAAAEGGFQLILLDCLAVEGGLTTLEMYDTGRSLAEYCQSRSMTSLKVAAAGHPPAVNGFGARVASNRGLLSETFPDLKTAERWLMRFTRKAATQRPD